ncbi:MAG: class I SAM-dependent methyltransferase [Chloroflexi bacterium]|nr:class I SAM-dependent methyltransferase [Chloroflexota bacterium]
MTLDNLHFLLSPEGERWLRETAVTPITPHNHLQIVSRLRKYLPPAQTQAVLETAVLRQQATTKFGRAGQMFFTRPALEQSSSEIISRYRARRFAAGDYTHVADLGCGIGGDALGLAEQARVTAVDWDPVRLTMAQENVRVYGGSHNFQPLQADLLTLPPFPVEAVFFDPGRRDEHGRRFFSVQQYQPPLSLIERWREKVTGQTAVKISPGVQYAEIPADTEAEFISVQGNVKECVLWYEDLRSGVNRRATLLPAGVTLTDLDLPLEPTPVTRPKAFLYEPDGAVIRAHLVQALALQLGASKIDEEIAYVTADTAVNTPFATCYTVEDVFPFQLKRLRHYLQERQIGRVTIKKRGSAIEPETLQQQLRLRGPKDHHCFIFLTRIQGEAAVIIGQKTLLTIT